MHSLFLHNCYQFLSVPGCSTIIH
uniref:Uncharacterized protein n=1 Tax=Arundo donax TaxID=35708 RepID=A0A0A9AI12_ARUDO